MAADIRRGLRGGIGGAGPAGVNVAPPAAPGNARAVSSTPDDAADARGSYPPKSGSSLSRLVRALCVPRRRCCWYPNPVAGVAVAAVAARGRTPAVSQLERRNPYTDYTPRRQTCESRAVRHHRLSALRRQLPPTPLYSHHRNRPTMRAGWQEPRPKASSAQRHASHRQHLPRHHRRQAACGGSPRQQVSLIPRSRARCGACGGGGARRR